MMPSEKPSSRLVRQRIRNRIIDQLELAASLDDQLALETAVPFVNVPYEVINGWEGWVRPGEWPLSRSPEPLSNDEVEAVRSFNAALDDVADKVRDGYPTVAEVQGTAAWTRLREAAEAALAVFSRRGRLPEDVEVEPI